MSQGLPHFVRHLLSAPPQAGDGVHVWLFRVARQLHAHLPAVTIFALLKSRTSACGRHVSDSEIMEAIRNSLACAWQPSKSKTRRSVSNPKWPTLNLELRAKIIREGGGLVELQHISPYRIEDKAWQTEQIIDRLFPGNPLLCVGQSNRDFDTRTREDWRGKLALKQLIVPSPMTRRFGQRKKDNKLSAHTLENTGARRFLICEFDSGTFDEHAALLLHLGGFAPLVCAVHSGGKSLHGWFFVAEQPEVKVERFFRYAVSLGADSQLWTRSQFCRIPGGTRDNGNPQRVVYLNFKPMEAQ